MKKSILITGLALVLMLAFATSAYAIGPAYVDWDDASVHNAAEYVDILDTPHKDYRLYSEKCAVCHSVHAAGWYQTDDNLVDGPTNTITSGVKPEDENSELLLRGSAANACVYCHVETAIGGKQIYTDATGTDNYYNGEATPYAHDGPDDGHASCANCHSVHGANTIDGAVSSKILKSGATGMDWGSPYQSEFTADKGDIEASLDRDLQVTGFCTKCHGTYSNASEQVVSNDGYFNPPPTTGVKFFSNHPLKSAEATLSAAGATYDTAEVAWIDANYCRSCHGAGLVDQGAGQIVNSFPHITPANAYFLLAASDASSAQVDVLSGYEGSDGVCLRCHADTGVGVGIDF